MKNIIKLLILALFFTYDASAQYRKGEEFLMLNINSNLNRNNNFSYPYINQNERIVSLLAIKAINKEQAWRLGIGYKNLYSNSFLSSYSSNDTTYQKWTAINSSLPHLIGGKEWRKYLHKDVMIIGGVDAMLGGGPNDESTFESFYHDSTGYYGSQGSYDGSSGFAIFGSLAPFTGIRISWWRLALGYNISANWQATYVNSNSINLFDNDLSLKQNVSIGYRFNNKKPIRKRKMSE